jgi:hypothetical protein
MCIRRLPLNKLKIKEEFDFYSRLFPILMNFLFLTFFVILLASDEGPYEVGCFRQNYVKPET